VSDHIFTESEIEALALLFLTQIRKRRKSKTIQKISNHDIFSELEDYLYHEVMGGYPISYIPSDIVDVIPKLGIDKDEALIFASYLSYCLLRRSDEYAIKMGFEPMNELDLLVQFPEKKYAFKTREEKLGPTLLSQDIEKIVRRGMIREKIRRIAA
jgi:hypothetical protein